MRKRKVTFSIKKPRRILSSFLVIATLVLSSISFAIPLMVHAAAPVKVPTSPNSQYYFTNWTWDTQSTPSSGCGNENMPATSVINGQIGDASYQASVATSPASTLWQSCKGLDSYSVANYGGPSNIDQAAINTGVLTYTFSKALPANTTMFFNDLDGKEGAGLVFYDCSGNQVDSSNYQFIQVSPDSTTIPTYTVQGSGTSSSWVVSPGIYGAGSPNETVGVMMTSSNVCKIVDTAPTPGAGAYTIFFGTPPATPFTPAATDTYTPQQNIGTQGCNTYLEPSNIATYGGKVYVTDTANYSVDIFDVSSGAFLGKFGSYGSGNGQFYGLAGIAIDGTGNIYVLDVAGNYRVQKFDNSGNYLSKFGSYGSGNGQFSYGQGGIAIDASGNIYVADSGNNRVQKFTSAGVYSSKFGAAGSGNGQFNSPQGIAIDASGNIFVVDSYNNRVQKFTSAGVYASQFATFGSGNGQLSSPQGIAIDASGNIYVADSGNNRVQKFTSAGAYISQFGTYGSGNVQFSSPQGIAKDTNGDIYIADRYNNRIQKVSAAGTYIWQATYVPSTDPSTLCKLSGLGRNTANGDLYALDSGWKNIKVYDTSGNVVRVFGDGQLSYPSALAVDATGASYVIDSGVIKKFAADGTYLSSYTPAPGQGTSTTYQQIAVDPSGNIYVTVMSYSYDSSTSTWTWYPGVQKYASDGTLISQFGSQGTGNGQFGSTIPGGIATDAAGNVYVGDSGNNRIQKFDSNGTFLPQISANASSYLSLDASGNIYAADGSKVYKYDATGQTLSVTTGGGLGNIVGVVADDDGHLYAGDGTNNRINVWTAPILPSAPQSVTATQSSPTSMKVSWQAPAHTGSEPLTGYEIRYRAQGTTNWTTAGTVNSTTYNYDLTGLVAGVTYDVQIVAVNALGKSIDIPIQANQAIATTRLTVASSGSGTLAETGENTWLLGGGAGLLLVGGGVMMARIVRRRVV